MLIVRKNQLNNLIATVSMNKTLPNPYYLFSFQHIASKDRVSFIPEVVLTNTRYDKFRFIEGSTNPSTNPLTIQFPYEGQYYYSIYEQVSSGNTNIALAYNKLESGRAVVIVGDDQTDACFFEPYISNNEDDANIIYISEEEQFCISGDTTPTPTASNTVTPTTTPTNTPTITPTPTCPVTTQYLEVELQDNTKFRLVLWNQPNFTSPATANCDYIISGAAYGSLSTVYYGEETIDVGQHQHQFDLAPILQPGETVVAFDVFSYTLSGCTCPVNLVLPDGNMDNI